ncbi:uncharacterized protein PHACADRAFT_25103 [Phanerochaete carnosa HHB-10118-sp]|uniref:F-box domain-containing protein n=1 Tax=Phanerochaete carnosa (strain HHB-10118-sp) TaxID=650164 RepID=K5W4Y7_PHACS|nr:uncharacterized protein PHACADRAFT_25103 [Phanerochaete carnosa HHB-10118-sp]EKM58958.1 hypothetical protein PHACADRAFT_25103 [Phanerochaete carnosa HHB-10118-sp]
MHRALQISEILVIILRSIEGYSKPTAAAVVSTCRTFYEPASDILWEDMPRLQPLLSLLPGDTLAQSGFLPDVARELGGEQWARFLEHAARVKILELTPGDSEPLMEHLRIILFMRARSAVTIFPDLRDLEVGWGFLFQPSILHLPLFLSPKTQVVRLWTEDKITLQVLYQLVVFCPQLRCLEVPGFPERPNEILWFFEALEKIHTWKNHGHPADLTVIAHLPTLRHLSITLREDLSGVTLQAIALRHLPL